MNALKPVGHGGLSHPTIVTCCVAEVIERIVQAMGEDVLHRPNVNELIIESAKRKCGSLNAGVLTCHNILHKIAAKFCTLRLHIAAKDVNSALKKPVPYNSKSACGKKAAANCYDAKMKQNVQPLANSTNIN